MDRPAGPTPVGERPDEPTLEDIQVARAQVHERWPLRHPGEKYCPGTPAYPGSHLMSCTREAAPIARAIAKKRTVQQGDAALLLEKAIRALERMRDNEFTCCGKFHMDDGEYNEAVQECAVEFLDSPELAAWRASRGGAR